MFSKNAPVFVTWVTLLVIMLLVRNYCATPASTVMFWGLLVVFISGACMAGLGARGRIDFGDPFFFSCVTCWFAWGLVSAAMSPDRRASFVDMARYALLIACFCSYLQWPDTRGSLIRALRVLWIILVVYAVLLIPKITIDGGVVSRLLGTYWHSPAESGSYYAAFVPLYLGLVTYMRGSRLRAWLGIGLFVVACAITRSSSALFGMAAGVLALFILGIDDRRRPVCFWGALAAFVAFLCAMAFVRDFNGWLVYQLSGRERIWQAALQAVRSSPVFGVGPGRWQAWFGANYHAADFILDDLRGNIFFLSPATLGGQAHNLFLTKAAEMGLPSLAFLIGMLVSWWRASGRILGSLAKGFERDLVKSAMASFLGLSFFCLFENGPIIGVAREGEVLLVTFILAIPFAARSCLTGRSQST
jgi:O-antigen ligase